MGTWPTTEHRHHFYPKFLFGFRCWSWYLLECVSSQKCWNSSVLTGISDSIQIFVTQTHKSFLTHLNFIKIKLLKFRPFFKIHILMPLWNYILFTSRAKISKFSFLCSQYVVNWLIFQNQCTDGRNVQGFFIGFLAFPRAKGWSITALLLAPCSSCCLDPVRSCWKPLYKVRKLFLYWHWISLGWSTEDSRAIG